MNSRHYHSCLAVWKARHEFLPAPMQKAADRIIIFFDMDCFYCQVETRRLGIGSTVPLVVDQWGMLLSVNYGAKAIGVSRRTSAREAREKGCMVVHVGLIDLASGEEVNDINASYRDRSLYKASLDRYRDASEEVMTVIRHALPESSIFERASVDECYADVLVSDLREMFPFVTDDVNKLRWEEGFMDVFRDEDLARGALLGERVRSEIFSLTSFTVSCGVSETRQVAKLCCSLNKPDKLTVVSGLRTSEFMRRVPLKEIRGLGPRALEILQIRLPTGVSSSTLCGDLWDMDLGQDDFGKWMYEAVRGLNDNPVKDTGLNPASAGASKQFRPPLPFLETEAMLRSLCVDMIERIFDRAEPTMPKTLSVCLCEGINLTRSRQAPWPTSDGSKRDTLAKVAALAVELAYRTGWMSGLHSFDRVAVGAKEVGSQAGPAEPEGLEKARKNVKEYLSASRLHFMGTWRSRYLQYVHQVELSGDWGDGWVDEAVWGDATRVSPGGATDKYLLVDMDCFFVSVATIGLEGGPPAAVASGVGPTSEICSANYPARAFGVHAGSFVQTAREKCPSIIIYPVDPLLLDHCEKIWKKVIRILFLAGGKSFDRIVGKSCDEALLVLTGYGDVGPEELVALGENVKNAVFLATNVPCSVGIAPSRILAKMATSMAKPCGVRVIDSLQQGCALLSEMRVSALPGVGYSTENKLTEIGAVYVRDLVELHARTPQVLVSVLGAGTAANLVNTARGIDNEDELAKEISTVSAEKNFGFRNLTLTDATDVLEALCENLVERVPPKSAVDKVVLKLKMAAEGWVEPTKKGGIGDVFDFTRSANFPKSLSNLDPKNFSKILLPFLGEVDPDRIRGIGVSAKLAAAEQDPFGVKKRQLPGQNTLQTLWDKKSTNETHYSAKKKISQPISLQPVVLRESGVGPTSTCVVCGDLILVGSLLKHFLSHSREAEVCLCPVCNEPVQVTDCLHVASHFIRQ